ncbi:12125_t:CDS:2, partial [Funneliformis mosseae]
KLTLTEVLAFTGGILVFLNGRNITTLIVLLKVLDFASDVAFLMNTVSAAPDLFFPSIMTLAVPAVLNLSFVLGVMVQQTQQTNKRDFRDWLRKHIFMTTIITMLSMVDLIIMKLFVDITIFNSKARKLLLEAGIFNIFKYMLQLVILILFIKDAGINMLLLLTLFTRFTSLLFNIIYGIYDLISFDSEVSHIL